MEVQSWEAVNSVVLPQRGPERGIYLWLRTSDFIQAGMGLVYLKELLESQMCPSVGEDHAGYLDKRRRHTEPDCTTQDYTKTSIYLTPCVRGSPTGTCYYIFPSDARQPLSAILLTLTEILLPRHHCPQANLQAFQGKVSWFRPKSCIPWLWITSLAFSGLMHH